MGHHRSSSIWTRTRECHPKKDDRSVILLDTNPSHMKMAKKYGLNAILCDAMEAEELYEEEQTLFGAGYILALTDNSELNQLLMQRWSEQLDQDISLRMDSQ